MNTLVPAYAKQCAVDKADSGAFPHTASLHKENERDYNSPFKFSKSIVCYCLRKHVRQWNKIIMVMISAEDILGSR